MSNVYIGIVIISHTILLTCILIVLPFHKITVEYCQVFAGKKKSSMTRPVYIVCTYTHICRYNMTGTARAMTAKEEINSRYLIEMDIGFTVMEHTYIILLCDALFCKRFTSRKS